MNKEIDPDLAKVICAAEECILDAPLEFLSEFALQPAGLNNYHPYFDYVNMSTTINRLETVALAGDPDAARHLRDIAVEATRALHRLTSPSGSPDNTDAANQSKSKPAPP